ncbi:response regulator [Roseivivax sediminis]|uniref:DNA-binding response regulator, NarL/FixJ family, contains REC and HTH domains n=1 Tax=Roseivivax sediminis TaxID=936889 RepID=A0A1I1WJ80_9RHOB|nr:response regulator transcription factor [Roseivivax sediminis]SFD94438.1 DNA-binding response regulator, NarL/FixJ family, contains REC and HTH domains [Roseivivax sediminis]
MKTGLIVDDHPVTHLGCGQLLEELGYDRILNAHTEAEALTFASAEVPGLVVLDLGLPGVGGLKLIEPLLRRAPEARILIFSMNEQTAFVAKALAAGAHGYLSKNSRPDDFLDAVRALEAGRPYLSHDMAVSVAMTRSGAPGDPLQALTDREHQVLRLISQGHSLQAISDALHISYKTAANTSSAVKRKLGAKSTSEMIRYAVDAGLDR